MPHICATVRVLALSTALADTRQLVEAQTSCAIRSYLATAAWHGIGPSKPSPEPPKAAPWIPEIPRQAP